MEDGFSFQDYLVKKQPSSAVIIVTGYIGIEMADALARRGLSVKVIARSGVLKTIDPGLGQIIREALSKNAIDAGFEPLTIESECYDHKVYYAGATRLLIRVTADRGTHRLLGAQILGHYCTEVSKRIDVFAAAIFNDMTVEDLNHLDLSYTPPLGSPWDPVQMAAQSWVRGALDTA